MTELDIRRDVPLAPFTTLELGGPARHFVEAPSTESLVAALDWARAQGLAAFVLGGGSNLIVPDAGFDGLVIRTGDARLRFGDDGHVEAGAGVPWEQIVDGCVSRGWAGVECLTGIPGSTGATPIQNVGAYGQEVSEVIRSVQVVDRATLALTELTVEDCQFGYRDSLFKREPERYVVTRVTFAMRPNGPGTVRYAELERHVSSAAGLGELRRAVLELRRNKSMVLDPDDPNRRSAGSFFLNPVVSESEADRVAAVALSAGLVRTADSVPRYPMPTGAVKLAAGWLVEQAGFPKGLRRGRVGISSRHALALVHHGGGTTAELLALAAEVTEGVESRFGVHLHREPRLLYRPSSP